jgi:hypothetical protein
MYRLLAADFERPSARAISPLLRFSKCRRVRTSRSSASRPLSASWTWRRVSARTAARLAVVSLPRSCAASEADDACGQAPVPERDLVAGGAQLRPEVVPVDVGQLLARQPPQPEEEGQRRVLDILREAPAEFQERLLQDVVGIDPPREPAVETQADHAPQPLPMPAEELGQGVLVARAGAADQVVHLAGIAGHMTSTPWPLSIREFLSDA